MEGREEERRLTLHLAGGEDAGKEGRKEGEEFGDRTEEQRRRAILKGRECLSGIRKTEPG